MGNQQTRLEDLIALGTEVVKSTLPSSEPNTIRSLLFLLRALNAAQAGFLLFKEGFEMDAKSVGRVVGECVIEYSFIVCEDDKMHDRMNLFFAHSAFHQYKLGKAIAALNGTEPGDAALQELEARWRAVEHHYPNKRRWCQQFGNLRERAQEADRISSETNCTPQRTIENMYDLVYAESCEVAHPGPSSLADLINSGDDVYSLEVGPATPADDRTLGLLAVQLGMLVAQVAYNVGQAGVPARVNQILGVG